MKRNVALQYLDLLGHLVVRLNQILRVLRLIVKLGRQLVVLQDSESRLRLKLLVIERHQVGLSLLDFEVHLLSQLLDILDLLKLGLVDANHAFTLICLISHLKLGDLPLHVFFHIAQLLLVLQRLFFQLDVIL